MVLEGREWNQAESFDINHFDAGLVTLVAFDGFRKPTILGTGFAVSAEDPEHPVFCTAAHVLAFGQRSQQPGTAHHASTPDLFRRPLKPLDIDRRSLRALHKTGNSVDACIIEWAVWDASSDISFFGLTPQGVTAHRFDREFRLSCAQVSVGTEVAVLGYDRMEVGSWLSGHERQEQFSVRRTLVLRAGRVTNIHDTGSVLVRGPCFETTIPLAPGMSGSPVALLGREKAQFEVIGVASSSDDPEDSLSSFGVAGRSTIARIPGSISEGADGTRTISITFSTPDYVIPPDAIRNRRPGEPTQ